MHIYDFITDEFQYELKEKSRQRPNRLSFERSLAYYIELFLAKLTPDSLVSTGDSKYLHPELSARPEVSRWLQEYRQLFLNEGPIIKNILDETLEIYRVFIRGKQHNAVLRLHDLLDRHNLLDKVEWELLGGFFRCRWFSEDTKNQTTESEYYNHIPFDKRYLVGNQRFSVSGIPLLYLGSSLATSCFEMELTNLDDPGKSNLSFSFWGFNPAFRRYPGANYKTPERINIFDISNLAYDMLNDVMMDVVLEKDDVVRENIIDTYTFMNRDIVRLAIRKFALCQVCTFVTDKFQSARGKTLNSFYEEYILPQLLTEAIRLHKYDGIIYPSTKYSNKQVTSSTGWLSGAFKTNLAMFSHYNPNDQYDQVLIQNFVIDAEQKKPIPLNDLKEKIEERLRDIEYHTPFITWYTNNGYLVQRIRGILRYCKKRLRLYMVLQLDGQLYCETHDGNIELQFILDYTKFVLTELRMTYGEEFEKYIKDVKEGKYTFSWTNKSDQNTVGTLY